MAKGSYIGGSTVVNLRKSGWSKKLPKESKEKIINEKIIKYIKLCIDCRVNAKAYPPIPIYVKRELNSKNISLEEYVTSHSYFKSFFKLKGLNKQKNPNENKINIKKEETINKHPLLKAYLNSLAYSLISKESKPKLPKFLRDYLARNSISFKNFLSSNIYLKNKLLKIKKKNISFVEEKIPLKKAQVKVSEKTSNLIVEKRKLKKIKGKYKK